MSAIKIGTGVPMATDQAGTPTVVTAARDAEALGFESLWVPDLIIGDGTPAEDAALTVAAMAAATERVGIGFSVLTLPLRPLPWLAVQIATLQRLSAGRLLLGVGSGGFPDSPFWQALGVPGRERGPRTDAALRALPGLLAGEPVKLSEESPPLTLAPAAPMPPVLVGGNSPVAMRRAADNGGWFPSLITPEDLREQVVKLRELAERRGLPAPSVTVGGHLFLGDAAPVREARERFVRGLIDVHGMPPEKAARVPMTASTAEQLAEVFAAYEAAGADRIVTGPDGGDRETGLHLMMEARALLN